MNACDGGAPEFDTSERLDELLTALADQHRRRTLYYLQQENRAELDELAAAIAAWLHDGPECKLPDETVEKAKIELHHVHLPKLDTADVIEYDPRSSAAVYRAPPESVETFLEYCADQERD